MLYLQSGHTPNYQSGVEYGKFASQVVSK